MEVRSVECGVRSGQFREATRRALTVLLVAICVLSCSQAVADRKAEVDWRADPLTIATVSVSARTITLKNVCRQFERQTSAEFYVDRRFADTLVTLHITSAQLENAMTCVEEVTGLQWRLIDDMFFLTQDARGTAVVRWKERYQEARKTQVSKDTESRVQEWLYDIAPFPPSFDPVWELTPLQREQIAYQNALTVATMTTPQLDWLNYALTSRGFKSAEVRFPTDLLVQKEPELEVRMNAAMVIDSPQGLLIVEKPLAAPSPKTPEPAEPAKVTTITIGAQDQPKKSAIEGNLEGIWITDEKPRDLTALLKVAKARGFTNLFVPVLRCGQAIYPSRTLYPDIELLRVEQPEDRLKSIIDAANKLDMKVHAVLDTTLWGDATHPVPKPASYPIVHDRNLLDRTYSEQAQWQRTESSALNPDSATALPAADKSVYLCPASSQTTRLVRAVVEEIAKNYDIAGICLDRLEYPRSAPLVVNGRDMSVPFGYTVEVRKEMIRAHQVDPVDIDPEGVRSPEDSEAQAAWDKFRRGKLTGLITEVSSALKAENPDAICSVTLDMESDAQSPGHWSQILDIDAVLPTVKLDAADDRLVNEQDDVQAVNALYAAVSKYAAVVPVVHGSAVGKILDLVSALRPPQPDKGWLLCGNSSELVKTLEGLVRPKE